MTPAFIRLLQKRFPESLHFDVLLQNKSYLRIGGVAKYFLTLRSETEAATAFHLLREAEIPYFVLGRGTNTLIDEGKIDTVILQLNKVAPIKIDSASATAIFPANMHLAYAVRHALHHGLGGMEFAMGIPGSIGGAVKMNAGTHKGEVHDILKHVTILRHAAEPQIEKAQTLGLTYRSSNIKKNELVLTACFQLRHLSPEDVLTTRAEILRDLRERKQKQPLGEASLGSTFKNPPPLDNEPRYAAKLISEAGLQGMRIGGIHVSRQHANFIINDGTGTADDATALLAHIEDVVKQKFGISLEREIVLLRD